MLMGCPNPLKIGNFVKYWYFISGILTFMYFLIEKYDNWCLEQCVTSYLSKFDARMCCKCKIMVAFDFYHYVAL